MTITPASDAGNGTSQRFNRQSTRHRQRRFACSLLLETFGLAIPTERITACTGSMYS